MKVYARNGITNPVAPHVTEIGPIISGAISMIIIFGFLIAFFFLLWGGFQWITSGGDEAALQAARGRIVQALIGLTLLVAAWVIMQLIGDFFGFDFMSFDIPTL